jgi:sarcosine oxidase subunit gamma
VADHRLHPVCATGGLQPRSARHGDVTLAEMPDLAIASLAQRAGGDAALVALSQGLIGGPPPGPRQVASAPDGVQMMWAGPDQWFVLAPFPTHEEIAATLVARAAGAASVTEQTDGWVCFGLRGAGAIRVLERLCRLDLPRMEAGTAERTSIEHMGCFIICDEAGMAWRVLGARSSALSLWHALETVARGLS